MLITLTAKIFFSSHTKESRARMRNKIDSPPPETTQAPSAPPIFDPRDGVELTDAFGQLKRVVGGRDVGNYHTVKYFNQKVHAGELELILVRPDFTYRQFDAAEQQKLTVRAPHNYEEGCSVEPYVEEGRWYVRRSDLDKLTTTPAARAEAELAPARKPAPAPLSSQVEPEPESTRWQRDRTIAAIKTLHPPDGIRPKGVSIAALTNRINKLPEFKENQISEDTVGRALEDIKAALKK